jgi:hypothetical protein
MIFMATTNKKITINKSKAVSDKTINDYANDPYFIKKREKAEKFLKKAGLPESFKKEKK